MWKLLFDPIVFSTLLGGATWLTNRLLGRRADSKAARVTTAIATSSALMAQYAATTSELTPEKLIIACKGIVAIQLAKVGVYERDRAPYQHLIDAAIAKAVSHWVSAHPTPTTLAMPIAAKVGA